ncbi:VaFE repeat-containing surface-anchored protein [Pilimelia columellifera]|uniref:Uncharacterized protein n=1 Tax=Pilimelia columellifera subsp. columellifera TaxID=706583 RepID=A0ABP6A7G4_9ACTN
MALANMIRSRHMATAMAALLGAGGLVVGLQSPAAAEEPAATGSVTSGPTRYSTTTLGRKMIQIKMRGHSTTGGSVLGVDTTSHGRQLAYCVEMRTGVRSGSQMITAPWSSYPGANAADQSLSQIQWVVNNSIDVVGQQAMENAVSSWLAAQGRPRLVNGLQINEALAATQAVIWSYTESTSVERFQTTDSRNTADGAVADSMSIYHYLRAMAGSSSVKTGMWMSAEEIAGASGTVIGPVTVHTTGTKARLSSDLPAGVTLVDSDGNPIDVNNIKNGQKLYVKVAAGTAAGSAQIQLTTDDAVVKAAGQMFKGRYTRTQTLIIGTPTVGAASAKVMVRWTTATTPPPPATPETPTAGTPTVTTSATDKADGDRLIAGKGGTVTDVVTYTGLKAGKKYTLFGELMDKATGQSTGITATRKFTPPAANGTVTLEFKVDANFAEKTMVVFETILRSGKVIAEHKDINDAAQTVVVDKSSGEGDGGTDGNTGGNTGGGSDNGDDGSNSGDNDSDDDTSGGPSLPVTGASLGGVIGAGVLGLVMGAWMLIAARRRRATLGAELVR